MPEGKVISYMEGEYPELDGLKEGSQVKFEGVGTTGLDGLTITSIQFETEGLADRELKTMTKQEDYGTKEGSTMEGGEF